MFKIGDTVVYGAQGICTVESESEQKFGREVKKYLVLKPVFDNRNTIFVPIDNEKLYSKIQGVLTAEEINSILDDIPNQQVIEIENDIERKETFKQILSKNDRVMVSRLIKTLYLLKQEKFALGKKLHSSDEYILKEAEKLLYEEIAFVLNIPLEDVLPMIKQKIEST